MLQPQQCKASAQRGRVTAMLWGDTCSTLGSSSSGGSSSRRTASAKQQRSVLYVAHETVVAAAGHERQQQPPPPAQHPTANGTAPPSAALPASAAPKGKGKGGSGKEKGKAAKAKAAEAAPREPQQVAVDAACVVMWAEADAAAAGGARSPPPLPPQLAEADKYVLLREHGSPVSMALSTTARKLTVGTTESIILLFNVADGKLKLHQRFAIVGGSVTCLAWIPNRDWFCAGGDNDLISVFSETSRQKQQSAGRRKSGGASSIRSFFVKKDDSSKLPPVPPVLELDGHTSFVTCLMFGCNNALMFSAGLDGG